MEADDSGVAGFFEDLPVLMFVLGGVSLLMFSGVHVSEDLAEARLEGKLQDLAQRLADCIVDEIERKAVPGTALSVSSIRDMNLSKAAESSQPFAHWAAEILVRHPDASRLTRHSDSEQAAVFRTGFASRLFNALDDAGMMTVCEVRAIVWTCGG